MYRLMQMSTFAGGSAGYVTGVSDLEIVAGPGGPQLCAIAAGGGLSVFDLTPGGGLGNPAQTPPVPGASGLGTPRLAVLETGAETYLLPVGRAAESLQCYLLGAGGLGPAGPIETGGPAPTLGAALPVSFGDATVVFAAEAGQAGISAFALTPEMALQRLPSSAIPATGTDIADLAWLSQDGGGLLFAADRAGNTITAYRATADGGLAETDRAGAADGLGIALPSALVTVTLCGTDYLIAAAAGSSSLSVMRLYGDGQILATDHVIDSLATRFQGVTALTSVTVAGRVFVVAGGGDDGLSLFTLLPGGRLLHLDSIADSLSTTLSNVTAIAATVLGDTLTIYAAGSEAGISEVAVDLSTLGLTLDGSTGADTMMGGAGDDLLAGGGGADTLDGGAGDDILLDGGGADALRGGLGTDTFVFAPDGESDRILDFEPGVDHLDLTGFAMLYSAAQLDIAPTATGAVIGFRGEVIEVESHNGAPLSTADITAALGFGPSRPPLLPDPGAGLLLGGPGADEIIGGDSGEEIHGAGGRDTLRGKRGKDTLYGESGNDTLTGNASGDRLWGGDGDDRLIGQGGRDFLYGGNGNDKAIGGGGNDEIHGGNGNDRIEGRNGRDTIYGETGNDTLTGGDGPDRFFFADGFGQDVITDFDLDQKGERIDLSAVTAITGWADLTANHLGQSGDDVVITAGSDTLTLLDTSLGDLATGDFLF